ncbi:MAG: putative histidine kinase, hybrid [Gammaproteobacteria bacterium]|nr:putative histidine kinase, hybrid [Gammaproteobacteria bacterium]
MKGSLDRSRLELLEIENLELRTRLADAEQTIEAIRSGQVDALVIDGAEGQQIFSLAGAERPYRTLIEQMAEGAITLDREGIIHYCNRAFADMINQPLEALTGSFLIEHVQSTDHAAFGAMLRQSRRSNRHLEAGLRSADGTVVPVYMSLTLVVDGAQDFVCMVVSDLTERKQAERISSSEQFVQGLIDRAPIGVAVIDRQMRYVLANPQFRMMSGESQPVGRSLQDVFAPAVVAVLGPLIARVFDTGQPHHIEACSIPTDEERWWNINLMPVHEAPDGVTSILVLTDDITERRSIEAQLHRSQEALQETDRRKDEFLATLAHELRNPLAPIRTAAQLLSSPKLAPQQLHWAQSVIQRQVGHMALLLDDLLDIARITQGKLKLKIEHVKLTDIIDSAVEAARPLLDAKRHSFVVSLPAEEMMLKVDALRLSQVLSNLLTNAAKYTDPAGHIGLSVFVRDGALWLSVKDDGIGIAPESLHGIFEMFSQVDGASSRTEGGLGIGLALVHGLVDLHGGTVEAKSDGPGCGSEFTVRLPLTPSNPAQSLLSVHEAPSSAAAGRRVMVVDDNKDAADSLAMLLEFAGHEVRVAYSGRAALSVAQTFRPDVALLDIGIPDVSGFEIARELRRLAWSADIRLIALTGWGRDDDRQRTKEAGFDHHLTKPVDFDVLEGVLSETRSP